MTASEDHVTQRDLDAARKQAHAYVNNSDTIHPDDADAVNHGIELLYRRLTREDYRDE